MQKASDGVDSAEALTQRMMRERKEESLIQAAPLHGLNTGSCLCPRNN